MNLYYYLHDTNNHENQLVIEYLNQFQSFLKSPELSLNINIRELPKNVAQNVRSALNNNKSNILLGINDICLLRKDRKVDAEFSNSDFLLICINKDGEFAKLFIQNEPTALYGQQIPDTDIAVVYYFDEPYITWHEIFHLLGADDCYDKDEGGNVTNIGPTCEKQNCIMQYDPARVQIGKWPFICQQNIQLIRKHCSKNI